MSKAQEARNFILANVTDEFVRCKVYYDKAAAVGINNNTMRVISKNMVEKKKMGLEEWHWKIAPEYAKHAQYMKINPLSFMLKQRKKEPAARKMSTTARGLKFIFDFVHREPVKLSSLKYKAMVEKIEWRWITKRGYELIVSEIIDGERYWRLHELYWEDMTKSNVMSMFGVDVMTHKHDITSMPYASDPTEGKTGEIVAKLRAGGFKKAWTQDAIEELIAKGFLRRV